MVNKNISKAQSKRIKEGRGGNPFQKNAIRKKDENHIPQLLLALALCSLIGYARRCDVYVRYVEESTEELSLMSLDEREYQNPIVKTTKECIVRGCGKGGKGPSYDHMCMSHFAQQQRINIDEKRVKLVICEQGDAGSFLMPGLEMSKLSSVVKRLEATEMVHLKGREDCHHPKVAVLVHRLRQDFNFAMVQGSLRDYSDDMKFIFVHELFTTDESIAKIACGNPDNKKWLRTSN